MEIEMYEEYLNDIIRRQDMMLDFVGVMKYVIALALIVILAIWLYRFLKIFF